MQIDDNTSMWKPSFNAPKFSLTFFINLGGTVANIDVSIKPGKITLHLTP